MTSQAVLDHLDWHGRTSVFLTELEIIRDCKIFLISVYSFGIKVGSFTSIFVSTFIIRTNFIPFCNQKTIVFSWSSANEFQGGYFVIIICLQGLSATTLFASKHDHRMTWSIKFIIARCKSQSDCYFKLLPAISLFCRLFHIFARYFNKNSKSTNQSHSRNNIQHVIRHI